MWFSRSLLFTIIVATRVACGGQAGVFEHHEEAIAAQCNGAYVDAHGYCRLPNGRFAFAVCCQQPCKYHRDSGGVSLENTVKAVLRAHGIEAIRTAFSLTDVCAQEAEWDNDVAFDIALDAAINSVINDGNDYESPLALLVELPPEFDPVCPRGDERQRLLCYLNRDSSAIALVHANGAIHDGIYPPENGESVDEHWIFFLKISELSDHLYWAIVYRKPDSSGELAVYNYGFS